MLGKIEARLQRLEARIEAQPPLDDLTTEQITAMCFSLRAQLGEEVTDELLWDNAMSRESYEAALASVSEQTWERIAAWCDEQDKCGTRGRVTR
jgi:hypothetical protein